MPVASLIVSGRNAGGGNTGDSDWDVHDLAAILDTQFGIEVRAGWHCAALVHSRLGTQASHGTLRLSTGHSTSMDDVTYTLDALREILSS